MLLLIKFRVVRVEKAVSFLFWEQLLTFSPLFYGRGREMIVKTTICILNYGLNDKVSCSRSQVFKDSKNTYVKREN